MGKMAKNNILGSRFYKGSRKYTFNFWKCVSNKYQICV